MAGVERFPEPGTQLQEDGVLLVGEPQRRRACLRNLLTEFTSYHPWCRRLVPGKITTYS
ncbi:hypothetical protein [Nonomuraea sp. NPDC003214]